MMSLSTTNSTQSCHAELVSASQLPTETNSEAIYNHCVRFTEKKVQYATGRRNVFVHQLACNLNRKGISLNEALSFILTDFGYDEKEVTQTIHSAYGNIHEFGKDERFDPNRNNKTNSKKADNQSVSARAESRVDSYEDDDEYKPKPTQIDRLELFLSTRFQFRHNVVSGKLEYKINKGFSFSSLSGRSGGAWHLMNDFIENSMLRECLKGRIKTNLSSLRNLLNSDFCPLYNPFEDYFYNLPEYNPNSSLPNGEGQGGLIIF